MVFGAEDQKVIVGEGFLKNKNKTPRSVFQVCLFALAENFVQALNGLSMPEKMEASSGFVKLNPKSKAENSLSLWHGPSGCGVDTVFMKRNTKQAEPPHSGIPGGRGCRCMEAIPSLPPRAPALRNQGSHWSTQRQQMCLPSEWPPWVLN